MALVCIELETLVSESVTFVSEPDALTTRPCLDIGKLNNSYSYRYLDKFLSIIQINFLFVVL